MSLRNSRVWMEYLNNHFDECRDYFKFAMVWMSFNTFYSSEYADIKRERDQVLAFARDNSALYDELWLSDMAEVVNDFKKVGWLQGEPGDRTCVLNMRKPEIEHAANFNDDKNSCEDFFNVVYQIRCNFFHGEKELYDPGNKRLIIWAHKYSNIFWEAYLVRN